MLNYYDFISSTSSDKKKSDPLVCKLLYRPPSFLIGWVLYLFGFSANQTSFLATLVALFSLPFLASTLSSYFIIGVLMLFFVSILDCADGNIARASKTSSQVGNFFDALTGYVVYAFVPLSLSMHVFISAEGVFSFIHFFGIIAGVIAAITNILARLIYHNWINSYVSTSNLDHVKNKPNYFSRISGETGMTGIMFPFLLASYLLDNMQIFLFFYGFLYLFSFIFVSLKYASLGFRV